MSPAPPLPLDPIMRLEKQLERCQAAHRHRDVEAIEGGDWRYDYEQACIAIQILLRRIDKAYGKRDEMREVVIRRRKLGARNWHIDEHRRWREVYRLRREKDHLIATLANALGVSDSEAWRLARLDLEPEAPAPLNQPSETVTDSTSSLTAGNEAA